MVTPQRESSDRPVREPEAPVFAAPVFAAPGTLEEETIDEEEADAVRYEQSSDEGYEEFEEETRAAGQPEIGPREISEVRATVDEIHMSSLAEAGVAPSADGSSTESEEDSEELELEEAQAKAEALLDEEARANGRSRRPSGGSRSGGDGWLHPAGAASAAGLRTAWWRAPRRWPPLPTTRGA